VNDLYGHECGNSALCLVGKVLKESVRIIDVPCRYGGEEFAVILPGASLREAVRIAERLSENIRYSPVVFEKESVSLTASFGVAVYHSSDECTVDEFLKRADDLLYEAKNMGRNLIRSEPYGPMYQPDEVTADEKALLLSPAEDGE
jgi:diguanylate cyclase (GGDEF)-like protein